MRQHPHLYEINARVFLRRLSEKYNRRLTLAGVPEEEWQGLARCGFDLVWLMGVWQRSPAARLEGLRHLTLRREYDRVLPGWTEADVAGSPYAVYSYTLDPALGGEGELGEVRARLNRLGLGLVLDFIPNHLALDHPWTLAYPRRFVRGSPGAVLAHRDWFFTRQAGVYLAHGRDPYFPPWTDTVQVDFFSSEMRQALIGELERIAGVADGVRCDMAMLGLNSVFKRVWGGLVSEPEPETEFWSEAIGQIKGNSPGFLFLAEVYWGLEPEMQRLGFDYVYDKVLYDKLRFCPPAEIGCYIRDERVSRSALTRFTENHDELRAVTAFGRERSLAAAVVTGTLPGMRFFHDGQLEGKKVRVPVQLAREPDESPDAAIRAFYDRLLATINRTLFHEGEWLLLEACPAWEGNRGCDNLLAWVWRRGQEMGIIAINYTGEAVQGRLRLPVSFAGETVILRDELNGASYSSPAAEINSAGLYIELGSWQSHILVTGEKP